MNTARAPDAAGSMAVYAGRPVALLTCHGKQAQLAPVLEPALGCRIVHTDGYDTDRLGTFTRDVPREGTQLETARRKARIGMQLVGTSVGVASEGVFGVDPVFGMISWNVELLVWIDDRLGIEVCGRAAARARFASRRVASWAEAECFAEQSGFPAHGFVVRPDSVSDPRIRKEVATFALLRDAFEEAMVMSADGYVVLEVDARAHRNPTRQAVIADAARDLAQRLASPCPRCRVPGFALTHRERGL
ncbi:DUF6671 family protein, partial [Cognatilysobacter lacus]